jgi:hypothetical protein
MFNFVSKMNIQQWELADMPVSKLAATPATSLVNALDGCGRTTSATSRRILLMSRPGARQMEVPLASSADCPTAGLNWKLLLWLSDPSGWICDDLMLPHNYVLHWMNGFARFLIFDLRRNVKCIVSMPVWGV